MGWQIIKRPASKQCVHCKAAAWRGAVWLLTELGLFCSSKCYSEHEQE